MLLNNLKFFEKPYTKTAFSASDYGKMNIDLYFAWKGEEKTNPAKWYETLKWGAGKGVEMQMLDILKQNGIVDESYVQETDGRVDFVREGVEIHGYIDAISKDGIPIEIKSINNANYFDVNNYKNNTPRENYVGQLAVYMDFLNQTKGYLLVASIDGLNTFLIECLKIGDGLYQCGTITVNLTEEYQRWAELKSEYIDKDIVPTPSHRYKYDIETIDWATISKDKISKARNNHAVIGDWQVSYSPYKNKIIEIEGSSLGYSDDEIAIIKEKTAGYSKK